MKQKASRPDLAAWWKSNRLSCLILAAALVLFVAVRLLLAPPEQPHPRGDTYAEYESGVVTDILSDNTEPDPVSDGGDRGEQLLLAEIHSDQYKGETMQVYNYVGPLYGQALRVGDRAVVLISTYADGRHTATVYEYDRTLPLAGVVLLARVNSGQPKSGDGYEMDVITACVLGGVSISGGEGKLSFVIFGVLLMGVLSNGLIMINVSDYWQQAISGLVLIAAVAFDQLMQRMKARQLQN